MKSIYVLVLGLATLACACGKEGSSASPSETKEGTASPAAAGGDVSCDKVVEKIASLNPPDMRGDAEKKLWNSMCASMKPAQKTCVMGAKAMEEMQACMK